MQDNFLTIIYTFPKINTKIAEEYYKITNIYK